MQRPSLLRPLKGPAPRPWVWYSAAALTLVLLAPSAALLFDSAVAVGGFPERAIGLSTWMGVDASGYASNYVRLVATGTGLACLFLLGLAILDRQLPATRMAADLRSIEVLTLAATAVIFLGLVAPRFGSWRLGVVCLLLATLLTLAAVVRERLSEPSGAWQRALAEALNQRALLTCAALLPLPVYYLCCLLLRAPLAPLELGLVRGSFLYVTVVCLCAWGLRALVKTLHTTRLGAWLGTGTCPNAALRFCTLLSCLLIWLPATGVAANELQYLLTDWGPRRLAAVTGAIWILGATAFASLAMHRGARLRPPRTLSLLGYPSLVAVGALLKVHDHVRLLPTLDMFHKGEQVVPTQQLFDFGKVPFFDIRPVHTLSDMTYQFFYAAFAGTERPLDLLIWEGWAPSMIGMILLYFMLLSMTSPLSAVVVCTCLPALSLIEPYYAPALLVPITLAAVLRRPTSWRWACFVVAWLAVGLWRIDFGLAATAAAVGVAAVHSLRCGLGWLQAAWRPLLIGAAAATAIAGVLAIVAERPTLSSLRLFFMTYLLRFATRTRPEIADGYSFAAAFQYYVMPGIAMLAVVIFVSRYLFGSSTFRARRERLQSATLAVLAAFGLVMSVRSLERHSLIEGYQPYVFFLIVALFPLALLAAKKQRSTALGVLLVVMVLRALITLPPFGFASGYVPFANLGHEDEAFSFRKWEPGDARTIVLETRHEKLVQFLTNNLDGDQTFFDFTNSPMLYALAGRRFPTYIIPNLEQTADTIQDLTLVDLESLRSVGELPFVIFKQGTHWDSSDGIANEIRSYRIAEWIYRHYHPLGTIDDYEVWATPEVRHEDLTQIETSYVVPMRNRPRTNDMARLGRGEDGQWRFQAGGADPFVYRFAQLAAAPAVDEHPHWRLRLHYRVESPGKLEVYWRYGDQDTFEQVANYQWVADPTPAGVYLSATMQLERVRDGRELFELRIDPPKDTLFELARVEMVGIEPLWPFFDEYPIRQRYDLRHLADIWARLDPKNAIDNPTIGPLSIADEEILRPSEWRLFAVPEQASQRPAYLHLRLRTLEREGELDDAPPGYAKILYLRSSCCGHDFRLHPADGRSHDYLIRLSTQWRWWQDPVKELRLGTNRPLVIESVRFLEGD